MNQPLVSIIVPVYKVEKYLRRCLDSIAAQTYTNFEAILVDDGSPDRCGEICDEYAAKDTRFRVIHQENRGVSAARNTGLDACMGSYVMFIDSDDYIAANMCEMLVKNAIQNKAQIVMCGFYFVYEGKQTSFSVCPPQAVMSGKDATIQCLGPKSSVYSIVVWNKLYKRNLFEVEACKVRFPEGLIYEDEFVSYKLLYLAERVSMMKEPLYYYWQREGSIIHGSKHKKPFISEKIILEYFRWAKEYAPDMIDLVKFASIRFFNGLVWDYVRGAYGEQSKAILKDLNNLILANVDHFFFNPYADFKQKKNYLFMCLHMLIFIKRIEWLIKGKRSD